MQLGYGLLILERTTNFVVLLDQVGQNGELVVADDTASFERGARLRDTILEGGEASAEVPRREFVGHWGIVSLLRSYGGHALNATRPQEFRHLLANMLDAGR